MVIKSKWRHDIWRYDTWHHNIWRHDIWHHDIWRHNIWHHDIWRNDIYIMSCHVHHNIWRHDITRHNNLSHGMNFLCRIWNPSSDDQVLDILARAFRVRPQLQTCEDQPWGQHCHFNTATHLSTHTYTRPANSRVT